MKFPPPLDGLFLELEAHRFRGRMSLLLIKRPDATTDAASGRFLDVPFIPQRLTFSVRPNR
jgi:hypothetical protein